jgi:hypothetical protein
VSGRVDDSQEIAQKKKKIGRQKFSFEKRFLFNKGCPGWLGSEPGIFLISFITLPLSRNGF